MSNTKAAVVLCGCGRGDGSEIHESVSVLVHLARHDISYRCFAPDLPQADVIDHVTGKPVDQTRNLMVEAARISRGEISPLASLNPSEFDALIFPGGFGVAKNLCTFANDGADCSVHPDVERIIKAFHAQHKPIGLCCIAPVLAARVLGKAKGGPGCSISLGKDPGPAAAVAKMGSTHAAVETTQAHTDHANRLVTSPAYMHDANPFEVFTGIGKMIDGVAALMPRAIA